MYALVRSWFGKTLRTRFPRSTIETFDTSLVALNRFLEGQGLDRFFPQCRSYEICVDITAVIRNRRNALLGFVECKLKQISLRDISQLMGYSRVASPVYAIILSPSGVTPAVQYLLSTLGRLDVLEYAAGRRVKVATWDPDRKEIHLPSFIPPGEY